MERARMIEILCSGLEGQMYSIDNPHILLKHTAVATDYRYQLVSLDISIPRLLNTRHNVFQ